MQFADANGLGKQVSRSRWIRVLRTHEALILGEFSLKINTKAPGTVSHCEQDATAKFGPDGRLKFDSVMTGSP